VMLVMSLYQGASQYWVIACTKCSIAGIRNLTMKGKVLGRTRLSGWTDCEAQVVARKEEPGIRFQSSRVEGMSIPCLSGT